MGFEEGEEEETEKEEEGEEEVSEEFKKVIECIKKGIQVDPVVGLKKQDTVVREYVDHLIGNFSLFIL